MGRELQSRERISHFPICPYCAIWIFLPCVYKLLFLSLFFNCSSTVVSIFFPLLPPLQPPPPPSLDPNPLGLCPCVLYTCFLTTLCPFHPIIPLPPPLCQFVLYFNVSGYILLACLFC